MLPSVRYVCGSSVVPVCMLMWGYWVSLLMATSFQWAVSGLVAMLMVFSKKKFDVDEKRMWPAPLSKFRKPDVNFKTEFIHGVFDC